MDEKQLQFLFDNYAKDKGFKDIHEFRDLMNDSNSRKVFFDDSNKELGFKDFDDFEKTLSVQKKNGSNDLPPVSDNGLSTIPTPEVQVTEEKDPITLSLEADELGKKTKLETMPSSGKGGQNVMSVPDEEAKKESKLLRDEVKIRYGFDANELANEHKGLTESDYGKEGFSKPELLADKSDNGQLYQRKISRLKWKSGLDKSLADNLIEGNLTKDEYDGLNHAIESSLQNASIGDYNQQRGNINTVANAIKRFGGDNKDELLKDYAIEVSKVYGNSYKTQSAKPTQETPESQYLNSDAQLGYQYLKDISPEKSAQYDRLFIDPKTLKDKPDELKGYNHLMQTLEETGIGLKENAVNEDLNNLSKIAKNNGGLTPEQLEQAKTLETKKAEISAAKNELDQKYPDRIENKVDDAMQDILGQKIGWGSYAGGMVGKAIKNTAQGVWEGVSEPFMSDASNNMRELAIMGETLDDNKVYAKTDANKNFLTDQLMIKPELQAKIDVINNDKSLTRDQKEAKLYPLLKSNTDKFGRVPIQGGKFNVSPSSILYGLTDIGAQLVPFVALEAATGGIGGASTAAKFLRTFTAAAATGFHDEYANAIMEGKPASEAYKQAMGMTAISAAGMAGAGTAEKVRAFYSGAKSSAAKIIEGMSNEAIEKGLAKGAPKGMKAIGETIKDRLSSTPKMFSQGLKTGAEFEGAMTAANEVKHQIYGTDIDREQNFKQSLLGIANFGILGAGLGHLGYKSPTELQKSGFVEFGKNPEEFKLAAKEMQKNGQLTKDELDHRNLLIDKSAEAYKTLPKANAKGKPLSEKDKGDYIYNSVVKSEGKKAASTLPPRQAEKAEHTALVADYKNDLILEPKTDAQLQSRVNAIEKKLEPKTDDNGKSIELPESESKQLRAELDAINQFKEGRTNEPIPTETKQSEGSEIKEPVPGETIGAGQGDTETTTPVLEGSGVNAKSNFKVGDQDTFYHASSKLRNGRLREGTAANFGKGVYFSTSKEKVTSEFGDHVTEVKLALDNPVHTNTPEWNKVTQLAIEKADKSYGEKKGLKLGEDDEYFRYDKHNLSEIDEIDAKYISEAAKELGYDAIIDKGSTTYDNEVLVLDERKIKYPEDLKSENKPIQQNEEIKTNEVQQPTETSGNPTEVVDTTGGEAGGGKEPPKVTPIEGDGKGEDWTAIRKEKQREIKAVKEAYEKQGVKAWSETMEKGLEKTQKAHPEKSLYDAALTTMHEIKAGLGHGDLTTDEALATMQYLKRELGAKRSRLAEAVTSDNELVRQAALMQDEALGNDYENAALAIKDITTTAGRTLNYAQSELRLDPEHGLQIRRMQLLRAKGGEKLTPEEMKWTKEKWDQERNIMEQEAKIREQGMKEDFDNRIADLQKEYEQKLKEAGNSMPANRAKNTKTLSQKGKDIADQIRKLKTNKGDLNLDITLGLRNLAIEGVAQLVEKGATVAEAIKEVLKDVKFKGLSENELSNHIIDGLTNKKDKVEQLDKIKEFAKTNSETDITNEMVKNNLIRDYVNSHVGEVEKSKVFETAFEDLKKVLPDITKEKLTEAYLKEGEFKQPTKKQLEGGIREQENELKRIVKSELTADQQQKLKLDAEKKNVQKKIKDFKRKLADNEFEEPVPVKLKKSDAELIRLKKQQSIIEEQYRKKQQELEESKKSLGSKVANFIRSSYVMLLISKFGTLGKVGAMSLLRPMSETVRKATLGKIFNAFFPNISAAAERGGEGSSVKSMTEGFKAYFRQIGDKKMEAKYDKANSEYEAAAKAYTDYRNTPSPDPKKLQSLKNEMNNKLINVQGSFIYKFIGGSSIKDALNAFVHRANEIEKQFGHIEGEHINDANKYDKNSPLWKQNIKAELDEASYVMGFVGRSHSALKTFSGRYSFAAGFMARLEGAVKNGEDISSPDKILEIANESYLDWERGKYQQSNLISDWWNRTINNTQGLEGNDLKAQKVAKYLLQFDVAITRVPVNILHEAVVEYTFGALKAAYMANKEIGKIKAGLKQEGYTKGTKIQDGLEYGTTDKEYKAALKEKISQMDSKQAATIVRCFSKGGLGAGIYAAALITGAINFGIFPHKGQKKKKEEKDLAPDELNPGQVMIGNDKLGETASGIIEHTPALYPMFMGLGMAQSYRDQVKKGATTNEAVRDALYTHLKIIEGSVPQLKIIEGLEKDVTQNVTRRATDIGLFDKEEYKGFTKEQLESDELHFAKDNNIKITAPPKRQGEKAKPNYESLEDYEKFTANRANRIADGLKQLKSKGLTEGGDYNEAMKEVSEQATKDARLEVFGIKDTKPKVESHIKKYRPLPVHVPH